jgi:hypothetical protein
LPFLFFSKTPPKPIVINPQRKHEHHLILKRIGVHGFFLTPEISVITEGEA